MVYMVYMVFTTIYILVHSSDYLCKILININIATNKLMVELRSEH